MKCYFCVENNERIYLLHNLHCYGQVVFWSNKPNYKYEMEASYKMCFEGF